MTNIKIAGIFIFAISLILAILSSHISHETKVYNELIESLNQKKAFTQDISKNIFYLYKNKNSSKVYLEHSIKKFLQDIQNSQNSESEAILDYIHANNKNITQLWNKFYKYVQDFRDASGITSTYSNILLEKTVNNIYNTNLMLIIEFDKLTKKLKQDYSSSLEMYKFLQYVLFFILILLLIYLFTQVKTIIAFVHKFLIVSKNIITNSSIKDLKPIELQNNDSDITQAVQNFNYLVKKIDTSIEFAHDSIQHSYESIEIVEQNIEELLELLSTMEDNNTLDKELTKKEDAIIQSLEELTSSAQHLKDLKNDLQKLISYKNNS